MLVSLAPRWEGGDGAAGSWFQLGPALAVMAIGGGKKQVRDLSLLSSSAFQIEKM